MQADGGDRYSFQSRFCHFGLQKKRSKKADERFYGCEKVANISQFGCLHYFQNSVIVHKEKKQKLMFNECFYIDKDKAKLYVQFLDQNF